jgi:hypothetical protein
MKLKFFYSIHQNKYNDFVAAYVAEEITAVNGVEDSVHVSSLQKKAPLQFTFNDDNEKPPISAKPSHRKTVRSSPEGTVTGKPLFGFVTEFCFVVL